MSPPSALQLGPGKPVPNPGVPVGGPWPPPPGGRRTKRKLFWRRGTCSPLRIFSWLCAPTVPNRATPLKADFGLWQECAGLDGLLSSTENPWLPAWLGCPGSRPRLLRGGAGIMDRRLRTAATWGVLMPSLLSTSRRGCEDTLKAEGATEAPTPRGAWEPGFKAGALAPWPLPAARQFPPAPPARALGQKSPAVGCREGTGPGTGEAGKRARAWAEGRPLLPWVKGSSGRGSGPRSPGGGRPPRRVWVLWVGGRGARQRQQRLRRV